MEKIKVAVCDDIREIRELVSTAVNDNDDMEVVGTAASGCEAVELVQKTKPDILFIDIQMESERAGIEAIAKIKPLLPDIKIVVLTIHNSEELVIDAYVAGAVDYMVKTQDMQRIADTVRNVYKSEEFVGPYIAKILRRQVVRAQKKEKSFMFFINSFSKLTATEREIIKMCYDGCNRREIAQQKMLEMNTIKTHITHILKKLNFNSTRELVNYLKDIRLFEELDI